MCTCVGGTHLSLQRMLAVPTQLALGQSLLPPGLERYAQAVGSELRPGAWVVDDRQIGAADLGSGGGRAGIGCVTVRDARSASGRRCLGCRGPPDLAHRSVATYMAADRGVEPCGVTCGVNTPKPVLGLSMTARLGSPT